MTTPLPDKWVRKAIYDRVHNLDVGGKIIPCYDSNAENYDGDHYIIMSTQTNAQDPNKCQDGWRSTIVLEVFTRHKRNHGSRVLADDIINEMLVELEDLNLEPASTMRIHNIRYSTPNDITDKRRNEVVHRKFLRYELEIN